MANKAFDILNIVGNLIFVILLLTVLINSISFWEELSTLQNKNNVDIRTQMYSISLIICIVTVLGQWISGRTKSIMKSFNNLKEGKNDRRKKGKAKVDPRSRNTNGNNNSLQV